MKFTKEQAFEQLRSFLTNGGKKPLRMSEKSVNAQLDTLIPLVANDEMELSDFIEKVKPTFTTMNSNAEKDNSDFIKNWKKDHPDPDPNPDPNNPNPNKKDPDPNQTPEYKALLERLEKLEKENNEVKQQKEISEKRKELVAKMKEKGISDNDWIDSFLGEVSITADMDIDAKAESFLKIYNKTQAGGGNVTPSQAGSGDPQKNDSFASVRDIMKRRNGIQEKQTQ